MSIVKRWHTGRPERQEPPARAKRITVQEDGPFYKIVREQLGADGNNHYLQELLDKFDVIVALMMTQRYPIPDERVLREAYAEEYGDNVPSSIYKMEAMMWTWKTLWNELPSLIVNDRRNVTTWRGIKDFLDDSRPIFVPITYPDCHGERALVWNRDTNVYNYPGSRGLDLETRRRLGIADDDPVRGTGRDPLNNYGIINNTSYACCGQSLRHPGCWMSLENVDRPQPYRILTLDPWEFLVESDDYNALQERMRADIAPGTYYLNYSYFKQLDDTIKETWPVVVQRLIGAYQAYVQQLDEAIDNNQRRPTNPAAMLTANERQTFDKLFRAIQLFNHVHCVYRSISLDNWINEVLFKVPDALAVWTEENRNIIIINGTRYTLLKTLTPSNYSAELKRYCDEVVNNSSVYPTLQRVYSNAGGGPEDFTEPCRFIEGFIDRWWNPSPNNFLTKIQNARNFELEKLFTLFPSWESPISQFIDRYEELKSTTDDRFATLLGQWRLAYNNGVRSASKNALNLTDVTDVIETAQEAYDELTRYNTEMDGAINAISDEASVDNNVNLILIRENARKVDTTLENALLAVRNFDSNSPAIELIPKLNLAQPNAKMLLKDAERFARVMFIGKAFQNARLVQNYQSKWPDLIKRINDQIESQTSLAQECLQLVLDAQNENDKTAFIDRFNTTCTDMLANAMMTDKLKLDDAAIARGKLLGFIREVDGGFFGLGGFIGTTRNLVSEWAIYNSQDGPRPTDKFILPRSQNNDVFDEFWRILTSAFKYWINGGDNGRGEWLKNGLTHARILQIDILKILNNTENLDSDQVYGELGNYRDRELVITPELEKAGLEIGFICKERRFCLPRAVEFNATDYPQDEFVWYRFLNDENTQTEWLARYRDLYFAWLMRKDIDNAKIALEMVEINAAKNAIVQAFSTDEALKSDFKVEIDNIDTVQSKYGLIAIKKRIGFKTDLYNETQNEHGGRGDLITFIQTASFDLELSDFRSQFDNLLDTFEDPLQTKLFDELEEDDGNDDIVDEILDVDNDEEAKSAQIKIIGKAYQKCIADLEAALMDCENENPREYVISVRDKCIRRLGKFDENDRNAFMESEAILAEQNREAIQTLEGQFADEDYNIFYRETTLLLLNAIRTTSGWFDEDEFKENYERVFDSNDDDFYVRMLNRMYTDNSDSAFESNCQYLWEEYARDIASMYKYMNSELDVTGFYNNSLNPANMEWGKALFNFDDDNIRLVEIDEPETQILFDTYITLLLDMFEFKKDPKHVASQAFLDAYDNLDIDEFIEYERADENAIPNEPDIAIETRIAEIEHDLELASSYQITSDEGRAVVLHGLHSTANAFNLILKDDVYDDAFQNFVNRFTIDMPRLFAVEDDKKTGIVAIGDDFPVNNDQLRAFINIIGVIANTTFYEVDDIKDRVVLIEETYKELFGTETKQLLPRPIYSDDLSVLNTAIQDGVKIIDKKNWEDIPSFQNKYVDTISTLVLVNGVFSKRVAPLGKIIGLTGGLTKDEFTGVVVLVKSPEDTKVKKLKEYLFAQLFYIGLLLNPHKKGRDELKKRIAGLGKQKKDVMEMPVYKPQLELLRKLAKAAPKYDEDIPINDICTHLQTVEKNAAYVNMHGNPTFRMRKINAELIEPLKRKIGELAASPEICEALKKVMENDPSRYSAFHQQTRVLHCMSIAAELLTEKSGDVAHLVERCHAESVI